MARVKIDWTKVEMAGPVTAAELVPALNASIQAGVVSAAIKTKIAKVTLNVGEGENVKQYGAAYLKIESADDNSVDSILSAIKASGTDVVIEAYNSIQRDSRLKFLSDEYGDVAKQIQEAVDACIELMGMDATEAREFVIARRVKAGKRVA